MTVYNPFDSARLSALFGGCFVIENRAPRNSATTLRGADHKPSNVETICMAHTADNALSACAQYPIDPLIEQARFVNEAAALERRLEARRVLRPSRSEAAKRGWEARRV